MTKSLGMRHGWTRTEELGGMAARAGAVRPLNFSAGG